MSSQEVERLLLLSAHVQTQILKVLIWQTQEIQKLQQQRTRARDLAALEQEAAETLVILAARARKAKQRRGREEEGSSAPNLTSSTETEPKQKNSGTNGAHMSS